MFLTGQMGRRLWSSKHITLMIGVVDPGVVASKLVGGGVALTVSVWPLEAHTLRMQAALEVRL
jgi:hypothetical protein